LIVTGRIGACGNTKRTARRRRSSGTIGSKSWPSAPSPCSQITASSGSPSGAISTVSSESSFTPRSRPEKVLLRICAYAVLYAQFYSLPFPMPSATLDQHERRQAITRLLEAHAIQRQAELVELLRQEGFPATQSSVSRDLRDLGAAKMKNG